MLSNNPLNPHGVEWVNFLGESQSRIYAHMLAKFCRGPTVVSEKKGGGGTDTQIMTILQVGLCQVEYCQQCVKFVVVIQ